MRVQRIPLHLIDEPAAAARSTVDDDGIDELAASIKAVGLLQPLTLRPRDGGRFEVVAGHRRLLALRRAGLSTADATVLASEELLDAARVHENVMREELSIPDEARYYQRLYEQLGEDVDRVAAAVRRPRQLVEARLLLLRGDPELFAALEHGEISQGVAAELNRIPDEAERRYYLEYARRGGCSVRQAQQWRAEACLRIKLAEQAAASAKAIASSPGGEMANAPAPEPHYAHFARPSELSSSLEERECMFCQAHHPEWKMYRKHVCEPCADRYLVDIERKRGTEPRG